MFKRIFLLFLICVILAQGVPVFAQKAKSEKLTLNCISAVLMDAETGQVVFEKKATKKAYPASITKILTVYLTAETCEPDEVMTASHAAIDAVPRDSTNIAIDYDEQLTVEQAANAAMLMSANDACNVLAEHISGDIKTFAGLMNDTAISFGAHDSNFINANGLPDENHYTTALDFAKITANVIKSEKFMQYFSNKSYTIPPNNKKDEERPMSSKHRMMTWDKYAHLGVVGGKTGYTQQAKHTAVTYAKKDNKQWIAVVMGASSLQEQLDDTEALLNYGYDMESVTLSKEQMGTEQVENILYVPVGEVQIHLPKGLKVEDLSYSFNKKQVSVLDKEGNVLAGVPVETQKVKKPKGFFGIFAEIAIWVLVVVVLFEIWRRHNIKKQRQKRRMQKLRQQMEQQEE